MLKSTAARASNANRSQDALQRRLARMGRKRRMAMVQSGRFSRSERALWAARYPDEVPLVNDELPWIAVALADID